MANDFWKPALDISISASTTSPERRQNAAGGAPRQKAGVRFDILHQFVHQMRRKANQRASADRGHGYINPMASKKTRTTPKGAI